MDEAIAEANLHSSEDQTPWTKIAKKYDIVQSTFQKRYRGVSRPREDAHIEQRLLNPHHEAALLEHIERLTR